MGPALRLPLCGLIAAAPLWAAAWCEPPRQLQRVAADDFSAGLARWRLEAEDPRAVVTARGGVLIDVCPSCRGVWLDRGELDKLLELLEFPDDANVMYENRGAYKRQRPHLQDFFD